MLRAATSSRGMVVAPHHLAARAGLSVLRERGNAIEAMVAAAAAIAVAYPRMNGLGGDGFWLIRPARGEPVCVLASDTLKLEPGLGAEVEAALVEAGHEVELAPRFTELMGHAGGVVRHPEGWFEGAADPRGDGGVAAW